MFELPFRRSGLLCIDIGYRNIKVAEIEMKKNNDYFIKNYGLGPTPLECIKNGHVIDIERMSGAIQKILVESDMRSKNANIVMSGSHIVSRVVIANAIQEINIDRIVTDAIQKNMPSIHPDTYQIDFKILKAYNEPSGPKLKIFITAVQKTIIDSYIALLDALDLNPMSVDVPANSSAKFFKNYNYDETIKSSSSIETIAAIDFGAETTMIHIFRNQDMEFNKSILYGSSNIDRDISAAVRIKLSEAEIHKKKQGLYMPDDFKDSSLKSIQDSIKKSIDEIVQEIYLSFDFYEKRCYGKKIDKIFVYGGGSLLKGLKEYLQIQFRVPVFSTTILNRKGILLQKDIHSDKLDLFINSIGIAL